MDAGTLSQTWLFLTVPALIGGLALVGMSIALLLRTVRRPELARLPLSASAEFELTEAGPLSFVIDKPRFRRIQARPLPFTITVSLQDKTGRVMEAMRALAPLSIEGVQRNRTEIANLTDTAAGHYAVRVAGLDPDVEHADSFLVIARPIPTFTFVASVVGIIASSALALGGLIASVATFVHFQSG